MKRILINLFYDGYKLADAVEWVARVYHERPTDRQIKAAQRSIKDCLGIDWAGDMSIKGAKQNYTY